jgi:non-ribosomal peptide synthetase component F
VVAQLAVLKAGGAFVSIDPSHPDSRLQMLIDEIGADLVLCSSSLQSKIARRPLLSAKVPYPNSLTLLLPCPVPAPGLKTPHTLSSHLVPLASQRLLLSSTPLSVPLRWL